MNTKHIYHLDFFINIPLSVCIYLTLAFNAFVLCQKVSSIYDAKSSCVYNVKKKHEIERISCNEYYLLKPFSTSTGAGSYTNVRYFIV